MNKTYAVIIIFIVFFWYRLSAQCLTPTTVPYYEDFQGLTSANPYPVCWAFSSTATARSSFSLPNKFLGFYCNPIGANYFFSRAIQLQAGITYSASAGYQLGQSSISPWSDFSILTSTAQSSAGLTSTIVSLSYPPPSYYATLSNTFTIPVSGAYYIAVRGTSGSVQGTAYLWWDDLTVTMPCSQQYNSPTILMSVSSPTVCAGSPVTLSASGAQSYTWSTGATSSSITDFPYFSASYTVAGTNSLTACSSTASAFINVLPTPAVVILAPVQIGDSIPIICEGTSFPLIATGASTYSWSTGQTQAVISVSPALTTVYTATGTLGGCSGTSSVLVGVNAAPLVSVNDAGVTVCIGETVTLTAVGAVSYEWSYNFGAAFSGNQVVFIPVAGTTTFVVDGRDLNDCAASTVFVFSANACTALVDQKAGDHAMKIFPNPTNGEFIFQSGTPALKTITLSDHTGKKLMTLDSAEEDVVLNLNDFAPGIYQLKIASGIKFNYLMLVKN